MMAMSGPSAYGRYRVGLPLRVSAQQSEVSPCSVTNHAAIFFVSYHPLNTVIYARRTSIVVSRTMCPVWCTYCRCDVLAESSTRRGAGLAVKARCPLHVNVTAALLDTLSDMQEQMARIFAELDADNFRRRVDVLRAAQNATGEGSDDGHGGGGGSGADYLNAAQFSSTTGGGGRKGREGAGGGGGNSEAITGGEDNTISRYRHREVLQYHDVFSTAWPSEHAANKHHSGVGGGGGDDDGGGEGKEGASAGVVNTPRFRVCHEFCAPLPLESRMSFTILNLTGQRTRYFQPRAGEDTRRLQYLGVSLEKFRCPYHAVFFFVSHAAW